MAVIGSRWKFPFLPGDPPIVVELRRVDAFAAFDIYEELKDADLDARRSKRATVMESHIESVTGVEVLADGGTKNMLHWPQDRDAILQELRSAPHQWGMMLAKFTEKLYGSDLGNSEPLQTSA